VSTSSHMIFDASSSSKKKKSALINYVAGVAGGISVVLVGHPFDTTKTRIQTAPQGFYKSVLDAVKRTAKVEGVRGFYAGMASPLLGQMFFRSASFMTFYAALDLAGNFSSSSNNSNSNIPSVLPTIAAGAATGFLISFIETPIDLIKTKLQIQIFYPQPRFTTFNGTIKYILKQHGIKGIYQGLQSTIIRNIPANAMFFPVNELLKHKFADDNNILIEDIPEKLPTIYKLAAGAGAGSCYWTLTYPLDAIKARVMAQSFTHKVSYYNIMKAMKFKDYFTGISVSATRGAIACSAMFYTVDVVRNYLHNNY
jgi:solute carrier family 25 (mitochondrial carnitine/acylcarnitine transporter), member 20/29